MVPTSTGKSRFSWAFSHMYFHDFNTKLLVSRSEFCGTSWQGPLKPPKTGTVPGKTGTNGIPVLWHRYRPWATTSELQQGATQELLHKRQGPRRDPEEPEGGKGGTRSNDEPEWGEAGAQTWVLESLINALWDTMPYSSIAVCLICLIHAKTHKKCRISSKTFPYAHHWTFRNLRLFKAQKHFFSFVQYT